MIGSGIWGFSAQSRPHSPGASPASWIGKEVVTGIYSTQLVDRYPLLSVQKGERERARATATQDQVETKA